MANYKLNQTGEQIQNALNLIDSNTATSGQVLTADGNGGASWQDASGGGGGGTKLYEHGIYINNSTIKLFLTDTNESAYTALNNDLMISLAKNYKCARLTISSLGSTAYLPVFVELHPQDGSPSPTPIPDGYTLTTYYLENKQFVSFTINSIDSDTVTPL